MIDWLFAPIDPLRSHDLAAQVVWHGRLMVAAWAFLLPLGIMVARYFKITRKQAWPQELDNKAWWRSHLALQYTGVALLLSAVMLVVPHSRGAVWGGHALFGYAVTTLCLVQVIGGWLRGTKGGPTDPRPDGRLAGDHYDMTGRRRAFEHAHKIGGYIALVLSIAAIVSGLWLANAPRWMWIALAAWWSMLAITASVLQKRGRALDTYQAIWGPDMRHPGNQRKPIGWGIRRPDPSKGKTP